LFFGNSGDADAVVPVTSTRYSIDALNLRPLSAYGPWYLDGQVQNKTQDEKMRILFLCYKKNL